MVRRVAYWATLVVIVAGGVGGGITYLMASPQAVEDVLDRVPMCS